MKIALCIDRFSATGGVGSSISILASGLSKAGHEVAIIATDYLLGSGHKFANSEEYQYSAICYGERWLKKRLELVLEHLSKYDIVINNHSIETRMIMPALPAHIARVAVIRSTNREIISAAVNCSSFVDALVGISPEVTRLLRIARSHSPIETIPNAVNIGHMKFPDLGSVVKLAYLGRLTDVDKNVLILPDIILACKRYGLSVELDIAGMGKDRDKLEKKIQKYSLGNVIQFVGVVKREAVGEFLSGRHFGIFPSNFEGFGLSLVEAMASGCIPVASNIPAYRWILKDFTNYLIVDKSNPDEYACKVKNILESETLYVKLQNRLKMEQEQKYTPEVILCNYTKLIDKYTRKRNLDKFIPRPLLRVPMSSYYRIRCSSMWRMLQRIRYTKPMMKIDNK